MGLRGTALKWFSSSVKDRSFSVKVGDFSSSVVSIDYGVPQGSIFGSVLFSPLGLAFKKYNMSYHLNADDIHIFLLIRSGGPSSPSSLLLCLEDVKC